MQKLNLPQPIAAYFQADHHDGPAVAHCFTPNGRVRDENRTYSGAAEIEAWKDDSSARYNYVAHPRTIELQGHSHIVISQVTGNFPGSPIDLRYTFVLEHDKIGSLEITP